MQEREKTSERRLTIKHNHPTDYVLNTGQMRSAAHLMMFNRVPVSAYNRETVIGEAAKREIDARKVAKALQAASTERSNITSPTTAGTATGRVQRSAMPPVPRVPAPQSGLRNLIAHSVRPQTGPALLPSPFAFHQYPTAAPFPPHPAPSLFIQSTLSSSTSGGFSPQSGAAVHSPFYFPSHPPLPNSVPHSHTQSMSQFPPSSGL